MKKITPINYFASLLSCFLCILLFCSNLFCKEEKALIIIDHEKMVAQVEINGELKCKQYKTNSEIFLPTKKFKVVVHRTNSALYKYDLVKKEVDSKDLLSWQTFMMDLVPFMISEFPTISPLKSAKEVIGVKLFKSAKEVIGVKLFTAYEKLFEEIDQKIKEIKEIPPAELERSLNKINDILYEVNGIRDIYLNCILLFKQYPDNPNGLATRAQSLLQNQFDSNGYRLKKIEELITELNILNELIVNFNESNFRYIINSKKREIENTKDNIKRISDLIRKTKETGSEIEKKSLIQIEILLEQGEIKLDEMEKYLMHFLENLSENINKATKLLDSSEKILGFAYKVENLAKTALRAKDFVVVGDFELSYRKGKEITLSIKPVSDPVLARYAPRPPSEIKLTLQRQIYIRPLVGLSAIYAINAAFSTFATKEIEGSHQIIEKALFQDSRWNLGLTLGITYAPLDGRMDNGFTLWIPEFKISPSSEVKYLGVGLALSYGGFKIGAGALWIKHVELGGGQNINDILAASTDLVVTDTYGKAQFYLSFSIIGWPPFKK